MIPLLIYGAAGLIGAAMYVAVFGRKHTHRLVLGPLSSIPLFLISPDGSLFDIIHVILVGFLTCFLPDLRLYHLLTIITWFDFHIFHHRWNRLCLLIADLEELRI